MPPPPKPGSSAHPAADASLATRDPAASHEKMDIPPPLHSDSLEEDDPDSDVLNISDSEYPEENTDTIPESAVRLE
jgi:hypothetical protein